VRRCLALAAEKPERLLSTTEDSIVAFLCSSLRNQPESWFAGDTAPADAVFLERCRHHGVAALVFQAMRNRPEWQTWPQSIRQQLERDAKSAVAQEMHRAHQLQRLLTAFAAKNIPFLVTKGEALARTHYHIAGVRSRSDSDLFIGMDDIETARKTVEACGFVIVSPIYKTHQFTVRTDASTNQGYEIDIHWRILNSPRFARTISFEEAHAESIELPGLAHARTLSDRHALLLACMHRVGSVWHDQGRLIWLYDIHLLASAMSEVQLAAVADLAVERNAQAACLSGLVHSEHCLKTKLPGACRNILQTAELEHRFGSSYLALLVDDWRNLRIPGSKRRLLRELFVPGQYEFRREPSRKPDGWWPLLYIWWLFSRMAKRLSLR
jgi:hypothetical protein